MDDRCLLREYARKGSQESFRELVVRHLPMVYSSARRMVQDPHLAEEVAQNVFITLAQKAATIRAPQVVSGWLYNTTRHLAMHAVRSEKRRREREQAAASLQGPETSVEGPPVLEHLEAAMEELGAEERDVLVLRFMEGRSLREVGTEFGISEDAARMRVNRALERLRQELARKGTVVSAVALAGGMSVSTSGVPPSLAATITTAALTNSATAAGMTFTSKALVTVSVIAALGVAIYQTWQVSRLKTRVQQIEANQGQTSLTDQAKEPNNERSLLSSQMAALREENQRLKRDTAELLRLRNQVAQLRRELDSQGGTVQGRVALNGTVPTAASLGISDELLNRRFVVGPNKGLGRVLVYLQGNFRETNAPAAPVLLDHTKGFFDPYVLGLQVGQELELRCTDQVGCSVIATPKENKPFSYALGWPPQRIRFDRAEMPIRLKCDLHLANAAYLGVFAHPFFAVTDEEGRFKITGIPAGKLTVEAFHPHASKGRREVAMGTHGVVELDLHVTPLPAKQPH